MVTYRTGPALLRAVGAVLADPQIRQLVLVDNGNPEDMVQWLDALAQREPVRVLLIRGQGNIGFGRACNLGAQAASGDVLVFLNPDTDAAPGALPRLARAARGHGAIVGGLVVDGQGREQRGARRGPLTLATLLAELSGLARPDAPADWLRGFNRMGEPVPETLASQPTISGACFACPADVFARLGGFDPRYFLHFEDVELCRHARRTGIPVLLDPGVRVRHKGGSSQVSTWRIKIAKWQSLFLYLFAPVRR
jgi:hypothetical protein